MGTPLSLIFPCLQTRPLPDLRDANAAVRLPAHRYPVEPSSRVQARPESVATPLVGANAPNIEVLTDLQPADAVGDLAVRARLLDASTEVRVLQRYAALVAARGIDNLTRWNGTVGVNPVAPSPTVGGGCVGDLLAVAV